jgi:hypothetical protein
MDRRGKEMAGMKAMAMLLVFQAVFLLSCEKEIAERGAGKMVDVNFEISNEDYRDEAVVRSAGTGEPETKVVALGFDDVFLYATLRPDTAGETAGDGGQLRAAKAFTRGDAG